jgi:hypothetical protein
MRHFLLPLFLATQIVVAPVAAADLVETPVRAEAQQTGAFVGGRLRIALGSAERQAPVRAGLVMAPTLRSESRERGSALRFGEGVELGFRDRRPLALSVAGRPVTGAEAQRLSGARAGVSTLGWIAIGTGVVLVAGFLVFTDMMNDASE